MIYYCSRILLIGITVSSLASCAVVKSESFKNESASSTSVEAPESQAGVIYFLPMKRMKLSGEVKNPTIKDLTKATETYTKAKNAETTAGYESKLATNKYKKKKAAFDAATKPNAKDPLTADEKKKAQEELNKLTLEKKLAEHYHQLNKAVAAQSLAALNALMFNGDPNTPKPSITLKAELLPADPDPDATFYARPWHSWLRDDHLEISVTNKGLLSSSNAVSDDKTADILEEIAGIAGALADSQGEVTTLANLGETQSNRDSCPMEKPLKFEFIFDPVEWIIVDHTIQNKLNSPAVDIDTTIAGEIYYYRQLLNCFGRRLVIDRLGREGDGKDSDSYSDDKPSPNRSSILASRPYGAESPETHKLEDETRVSYLGYAYRPQLPYRVSIQRQLQIPPTGDAAAEQTRKDHAEQINKKKNRQANNSEARAQIKPVILDEWVTIQSSIVMLPNEAPTAYIPVKSAAFVKTINDVKFDNGMIKSWTTDRPSEVLEIVRLPIKILSAIVSVPAEILKLRIDLSSQDTSLAEKQIAQLKTQETLEILKECLRNAEKQDTDAFACFPSEEE